MANKTISLTPEIYRYLLENSLRETEVMKELREETSKLSSHDMQVSPEQGQWMSLLIEIMGARRTLEIGTYTGYSALAVARALPNDGEMITCDINEEWTSMAQHFWKKAVVDHKIKLKLAPAIETLDKLLSQNEQFDFAFIDADKANYLNYYDRVFELMRPGGLIMIDNVLLDGRVADPNNHSQAVEVMRELNRKLLLDDRISLSMLPISDGVSLVRKKFY